MRVLIIVVVLAFSVSQGGYAQRSLRKKKDTRSFLERLFVAPKKKVIKKSPTRHKSKSVAQSVKPSRGGREAFIVEPEWMARYWELQAAWDYPIPDEKDIQFKDGKYHVPPVVYRHYEDMRNAYVHGVSGP